MQGFTPQTNFPSRKGKDLMHQFGGHEAPFYFTNSVVLEGTPMKRVVGTPDQITPCVRGSSDGAKCMGLTLQETYDDTALGQLRGYHFANDTRQPINPNASTNPPIGLLRGKGYALIASRRIAGTAPTNGQTAEVGPSGMIQATTGSSGDALPIIFDGTIATGGISSGTVAGVMYRIAFDFPGNV